MDRITVTLPTDMVDRIDDLAGDSGAYESRSEAVRTLIRQGERLEEVERERDRLREQLAARNARADDVGELVEYVEHERAIRREERRRRSAPVWKRAKWWVLGEPGGREE
jgi:Arc/MetJ-type ribon-helix-helix transcriptional regulator